MLLKNLGMRTYYHHIMECIGYSLHEGQGKPSSNCHHTDYPTATPRSSAGSRTNLLTHSHTHYCPICIYIINCGCVLSIPRSEWQQYKCASSREPWFPPPPPQENHLTTWLQRGPKRTNPLVVCLKKLWIW